jgi:hypothetical protein
VTRARAIGIGLRRALVALLAFMAGFPPLYAAVVSERHPPLPAAAALPMADSGTYRVFVADWGYHTAIVIEQPRGWRLGPPGEEGAAFLEYAWGDRRFYLESDYRPHALFAALALPTESVLYLDGITNPPSFRGARAVLTRTVDASTVHGLLTELERSARRAPDGSRVGPFAPASGYAGRFYQAHGAYLWARDCNWWTVARLSAVGLAGSPTGVVVTAQVPGRLRGFVILAEPLGRT